MSQKAFIIFGSTGQWDSFSRWSTCVFLDELAAQKECERRNNILKKVGIHRDSEPTFDRVMDIIHNKRTMANLRESLKDSRFELDTGGVDYYILERDLIKS